MSEQHPEEKQWSEIRNEILRKVELFTDRQIERFKASIHKRTAPRSESEGGQGDDVEESTHLDSEIERMDYEGDRQSLNRQSLNRQSIKSAHPSRKHRKRSA